MKLNAPTGELCPGSNWYDIPQPFNVRGIARLNRVNIMQIEIKFNCDNAAFSEPDSYQFAEEIQRILYQAIDKFKQGYSTFPLRDSNGNTIGRAGITTGE